MERIYKMEKHMPVVRHRLLSRLMREADEGEH